MESNSSLNFRRDAEGKLGASLVRVFRNTSWCAESFGARVANTNGIGKSEICNRHRFGGTDSANDATTGAAVVLAKDEREGFAAEGATEGVRVVLPDGGGPLFFGISRWQIRIRIWKFVMRDTHNRRRLGWADGIARNRGEGVVELGVIVRLIARRNW